MTKLSRCQVDGVLLLNKPSGLSSNSVLQQVKRLYNANKAGHTGTLDPLATGLLPICLGEATKFAGYLLDGSKEYLATIKLGVSTTTYDSEGEILTTRAVNVTLDQIYQALGKFTGQMSQVPPIYSALKVAGKPLYAYARADLSVEVKPRNIEIYHNQLVSFDSKTQTLVIRVACSKGTYIRTLAHDIGEFLACGGHLMGLVRTKTAAFALDAHITLDYLKQLSIKELSTYLLHVDVLVSHLPRFDLVSTQFDKVKFGNQFHVAIENSLNTEFRIYFDNKFLGVAKLVQPHLMQPIRLFSSCQNKKPY